MAGYYTSNLIDIDINDIISNTNYAKDFTYEFILHTPYRDITLDQIQSYETLQDYNNNVGDYNLLTFNVGMGTYIKGIYPYRDNLTCTILKTFKTDGLSSQSAEYKLVIVNEEGNSESSSHYKNMTEDQLNENELKKIEAQVYLIELEAIREGYVDGNYKNVTVQELMGWSYAKVKDELEVHGNPLELRIDIVEPDNDTRYNNLIIPTGVMLQDLPIFLQNDNSYGVYNGGCGAYLQKYNSKPTMFIYPLYTTERYEKCDFKKLVIYNPGNLQLNTVENTWLREGNLIKIVAGSGVKVIDKGSTNIMDQGEALVSSRPEQIFNRASSITDSEVTVDASTQLNVSTLKSRRDGMSKMKYVGNESNMYRQRTQIMKNSMATYQIPWHFSYPELIYPGMPVCYIHEDSTKGTVRQYGSVQLLVTKYSPAQDMLSSTLIITVGSYNVFNS